MVFTGKGLYGFGVFSEMIEHVMNEYGIHHVRHQRISTNVFQITDGDSWFALKRSTMNSEALSIWQQVLHQANHSNLPGVLPVYLTKESGSLYTIHDDQVYYLTPWIEEINEEINFELLFKTLGQIHQRTKFTEEVSLEKSEVEFKRYSAHNDDTYQLLFKTIQTFEKSKYMSPFELLVCSHFISLENILNTLNSFIKRFIDERKERSLWSLNLCHGHLKREHLIQSSRLYIANWEKATYNHAIIDLNSFFRNINNDSLIKPDSLIDAFETYLHENTLEMDELYLLVIYLLDCQAYVSVVKKYIDRGGTNGSMINPVIQLQQTYRALMFGLKFAEYVDQREQDALLDDLDDL